MENCIHKLVRELEQPIKDFILHKFKFFIIGVISFILLVIINLITTTVLVIKYNSNTTIIQGGITKNVK